ncbi:hypothetical protein [Cupriavidus sp. AcVe19-1a]|uniref:hypothetical protein n=1 Tax=Cupriavidus sp. AcVe19-1a TaxID=2821359 RepID=UPI001AE41125|nr:hypothetical protein [Cupriavidus sp. AcVe19-1a]MBP0633339.1 hypothetical protein [Cupriavidus sp. AcVe19-1a]
MDHPPGYPPDANEQDSDAGPQSGDDTITGLPTRLASGARVALYANGARLAIGVASHLDIFELTASRSGRHAHLIGEHKLPGRLLGLAESGLGIVVATECGAGTHLLLLRGERLILQLEVKGTLSTIVAAAGYVYAVLEADERQGRMVVIDLRQREVIASAPLEHTNVRLAVDPSGEQLVMTDRAHARVMSLQSNLQPAPAPQQTPTPESPTANPPHPRGCCCCTCQREPMAQAGSDPNAPGHPGESGGPTGGESPPGPDRPGGTNGQAGVPNGNGGTVVGNGGQVDNHPKPGQSWNPCWRHLFYTVDMLHKVGAFFIAASTGGRQAALLSADMNLLQEWQFGRGGALILTATNSNAMVMHTRRSGKWIYQDAFVIGSRRSDLDKYLIRPEESKVFVGQPTMYTMSHGQKPLPSSFKVLILPVMEGKQAFSSPNLSGFGAFINRTSGPLLRDYYIENSFGGLKDLSVKVFGAGVGPDGPPLPLPRNFVLDYYFPTYEAARVELAKNGASALTEVVFDGRESLTLQATPMTGGMVGDTVTLPFYALGLQRDEAFYPVQVKFLGTEKLTLNVVTPAGAAVTLKLNFTAKEFNIAKDTDVGGVLPLIATYLNGRPSEDD